MMVDASRPSIWEEVRWQRLIQIIELSWLSHHSAVPAVLSLVNFFNLLLTLYLLGSRYHLSTSITTASNN